MEDEFLKFKDIDLLQSVCPSSCIIQSWNETQMEDSTLPWKPCPRCLAQMPGERVICETCEAKEKGLPSPETRKFVPHPVNDLAIGEADPNVADDAALDIPQQPIRPSEVVVKHNAPGQTLYSGLALASLFFAAFLGPIGIFMAVFALRNIYASRGRIKGSGSAWLAIIIGMVWLLVAGMALYIYLLGKLQSLGITGGAAT